MEERKEGIVVLLLRSRPLSCPGVEVEEVGGGGIPSMPAKPRRKEGESREI